MERIKLKVVSAVDALTNALTEAVFNLEYQPGQQITEMDITNRFNVSRNTVREALTVLQARGLITKEANRGVFVKKFTTNDITEIFHFRELFEVEAVRMIFRSNAIPEALIHAMEEIEKDSVLENDPHLENEWYRFVQADLNFHLELVKAASCPRLSRLYEAIRHELMLCLCQSRNALILNPKNIYEHRRLIEILQGGNVEQGVGFIQNHIRYGVQNLGYALEKMNT